MGEALELIGARAQTNALEERDRILLGRAIADSERLQQVLPGGAARIESGRRVLKDRQQSDAMAAKL